VERRVNAAGANPAQEVSVRLGSYPEDGEGDRTIKAPGTEARRQGGSASVRAVTRVKPEQASKGIMRAPNLLTEDEGAEDNQMHRHVMM
jgi:hypothetical protein